MILDIDLDAFCCERELVEVNKGYNGITGYSRRIDFTLDKLSKLPRPEIITISRSQGAQVYCPSEFVDDVQDKVLMRLRELYGAKELNLAR